MENTSQTPLNNNGNDSLSKLKKQLIKYRDFILIALIVAISISSAALYIQGESKQKSMEEALIQEGESEATSSREVSSNEVASVVFETASNACLNWGQVCQNNSQCCSNDCWSGVCTAAPGEGVSEDTSPPDEPVTIIGNRIVTGTPEVQKSLSDLNSDAKANPGETQCRSDGTCVVYDDVSGQLISPRLYENRQASRTPTKPPPTSTPRPQSNDTENSTVGRQQEESIERETDTIEEEVISRISPTPEGAYYEPGLGRVTPTPTPTCESGLFNPRGLCIVAVTSTPIPTATPVPPTPTQTLQGFCNYFSNNDPNNERCSEFYDHYRFNTPGSDNNNVQEDNQRQPTPTPPCASGVYTKTGDVITCTLPTSQASEITEANQSGTSFTVYTSSIGSNSALGQNPAPVRSQYMQFEIMDDSSEIVSYGGFEVDAEDVGVQVPTRIAYSRLINLGDNFTPGNYRARFRLDNTLWKSADVSITPGTISNVTPVELVPGDIDLDNVLSLYDYIELINCYKGVNCTKPEQADLNLDGKIDELDLNIMLSSFSTRRGD